MVATGWTTRPLRPSGQHSESRLTATFSDAHFSKSQARITAYAGQRPYQPTRDNQHYLRPLGHGLRTRADRISSDSIFRRLLSDPSASPAAMLTPSCKRYCVETKTPERGEDSSLEEAARASSTTLERG